MMSDISATREVYRLQLEEFRKGGLSPEKVMVYEKILALIDSSGSVEEWKNKMSEENLWDLYGRAVNADRYRVLASAYSESFYGEELARACSDVADACMDTAGDDTAVEKAEKKVDSVQEDASRKFRDLHNALLMIIEYSVTSDYFTLEKKTFQQRFNESVTALGGMQNFSEMLMSEQYQKSIPYSSEQLEKLLAAARTMENEKLKEMDLSAEENDRAETWKNILLNSADAVRDAEKSLRERSCYRLFHAEKLGDEPGDVEYSPFWEKPLTAETEGGQT